MKEEKLPEQDYIRLLSHQLKSPINAIESLLNTILEGYAGGLDEQTRYILKKAVGRSGEAREIIADLLDYELYSETAYDEGDEIDVIKLCEGLESRYLVTASDSNISFRTDFPRAVSIFVLGDEKGLEHALRNLLENAFKYTSPRGSVSFSIIADTDKKTCTLSVADTGTGLPKDEHKQIFEPFYRSVTHRSGTPGTGLGLPIVKRVVDSMGGRIEVESEEGKGSTFSIVLESLRIEDRITDQTPQQRVVIIGGVTAGPKTAARLRRLDERIDITIVEKGGFLSYSGCSLPGYISGKISSPTALMISGDCTVHDIDFFETIENVKVLNNTLAVSIEKKNRTVQITDMGSGKKSQLPYDVLVLATGAVPSVPKIPGIDRKGIFTLRSIEDAEAIRHTLTAGVARDVCIVGGGLIGISAAEELQDAGARITILEKKDCILQTMFDDDMALRLQAELNHKGIKVITNTEVTEIEAGGDSKANPNNIAGETLLIRTNQGTYSADIIIISAGVTPNTDLARQAGLDIGESGGIIVNNRLGTSDECIYAVGDCAESSHLTTGKHEYWPLGSVSTKMGRIAADNICGRDVEFTGSIGTTLFKMRNLNAARTGLTTRSALREGFDAASTVIAGRDNPKKDPGEYIVLKIISDRKTGVVIGAQGFGIGNVAGKIEIAAMATSQKLTLMDVFRMDLGYSPDYNSPIELTQTACLTLQNRIDGKVSFISPDELDENRDNLHLVSVCPANIHAENAIPGAINVPLERLRSEGLPFDRSSNIVIYSRTSAGAYKAYRYLIHRGYESARVLEGGYLFWRR
jgi:NADPH-dependent 2,4-dienoyl-CoA reductase/sulfur reductase-like enzyme/rhodanese-related sulfurtransferase/two-component sensor histidine kinase